MPKINKNSIWESCYIKIDFKVKDNEAIDFLLTKNNDLLNVMFRGTPCIKLIEKLSRRHLIIFFRCIHCIKNGNCSSKGAQKCLNVHNIVSK